MCPANIAQLAEADDHGFTLKPEELAELIEDIFDCGSREELHELTAEIHRLYAPTPRRRTENDPALEPVRMAITARRAELRGRDGSARP